jgi:hypothetical protein
MLRRLFLRKTSFESKWNIQGISEVSSPEHTVHILIVGSRDYVLLAETCIWSFLRHHPSTQFRLHVDRDLVPYVKRRLKSLISINITQIIQVESSRKDWQALKLQIILSMNGSTDFFMDADLRWNDKLRVLSKITAYLEEFEMVEPFLPSQICALLHERHPGKMVNLSFFTFSGISISEKARNEIIALQKQISLLSLHENLSIQEREKCRMSEQIALSVGLNLYSHEINSLKFSDSRNDGQFVESCYFGATGLTF